MFELQPLTTELAFLWALYAVQVVLVLYLFRQRRFLFLVAWPTLIYGAGPLICLSVPGLPIIGKYFLPEHAQAMALLFFFAIVGMCVLDRGGWLSKTLQRYLETPALREFANTRLMSLLMYALGAACFVLQLQLLLEWGSILGGVYAFREMLGGTGGGWQSRYAGATFGILAGFYELFFCLTVILALNNDRAFSPKKPYLWLYASIMLLRLVGGTRLLVIKEAAVLLFSAWVRGRVRGRAVIFVGVATLLLGNLVGYLRAGGDTSSAVGLGPIYSFAAESGISAATLSIAYDTALSPRPSLNPDQAPHPVEFLLLSTVPGFVYNWFADKNQLLDMAPYNWAYYAGWDYYSPLGGSGLFTNALYYLPDPVLTVVLLDVGLFLIIKLRYPAALKSGALIALVCTALNFWRDPIDISFKLWVNLTLFVMALLGAYRLRLRAAHCADMSRPKPVVPGG